MYAAANTANRSIKGCGSWSADTTAMTIFFIHCNTLLKFSIINIIVAGQQTLWKPFLPNSQVKWYTYLLGSKHNKLGLAITSSLLTFFAFSAIVDSPCTADKGDYNLYSSGYHTLSQLHSCITWNIRSTRMWSWGWHSTASQPLPVLYFT